VRDGKRLKYKQKESDIWEVIYGKLYMESDMGSCIWKVIYGKLYMESDIWEVVYGK
jgi:hypothetical protein